MNHICKALYVLFLKSGINSIALAITSGEVIATSLLLASLIHSFNTSSNSTESFFRPPDLSLHLLFLPIEDIYSSSLWTQPDTVDLGILKNLAVALILPFLL